MRKFNITVNGKTYEVEVEEVGGVPQKPTPVQPVAQQPVSSVPKERPAQPPVAPLAQQGGEKVIAPMPGKVLKVFAAEGATVKSGEVVLILEAMKMENEITAPTDGTVKQITVKEGVAVNPGDVLFVVE